MKLVSYIKIQYLFKTAFRQTRMHEHEADSNSYILYDKKGKNFIAG